MPETTESPGTAPAPKEGWRVGMPGETGFYVSTTLDTPVQGGMDATPDAAPVADASAAEAITQSITTNEARDAVESSYAGQSALDQSIERAQGLGLDEAYLKQLIQGLNMDDKPQVQHFRLLAAIRDRSLALKPKELLSLAKQYQKERIKATENGLLYHYHQTSLENFGKVVATGGLMSYNSQKELGLAGSSSGSRPDVVQFTRDRYDADGKLVRPGLVRGGSLGVAGDVALVFDEKLMDTPEYDGIVEYPNVPFASTDLLRAVVVTKEQDIDRVRAMLVQSNLEAEVVTRAEWADRTVAKQGQA